VLAHAPRQLVSWLTWDVGQNISYIILMTCSCHNTMDTVLALSTLALAVFTALMAGATYWLAKESKAASFRQIGVQTWLEFQKRFDSSDMLRARKSLATELKTKTQPKVDRIAETVLNFFEDLGIVYEKGYIEKDLAEDSFGFYLCRWWEASKSYVDQERKRHREDETLFVNFEKLSGKLRLTEETIDDRELQQFLEDEGRLSTSK